MVGESKRGKEQKSMVPAVVTSATVWRSPITPWSWIGVHSVSSFTCRSSVRGAAAAGGGGTPGVRPPVLAGAASDYVAVVWVS